MNSEKDFKIVLSRKLLEIAKLVKGNFVADVGCDHGKLSIYLALTSCSKIYACDVREKPLNKAKENAKRYGVFERIEFILSDGLKGVPSCVDCIVVAGMGGKLIENIIFNSCFVKKENLTLILQPQSFLYRLRQRLYKEGFKITKEVHIIEKKKCYDILVAQYFGNSIELDLKRRVLGERDDIENFYSVEFLTRRLFKEKEILKGLKRAVTKNLEAIEKQEQIVKILKEELIKI